METVVHNIRDLGDNARSAAEQLVGHELREQDQLIIQIVSAVASTDQRPDSAGSLPAWYNVYDGLTDGEIADIEQSIVRSCSGG